MLIQANILQSGASLFTQSSRQGVQLTPHTCPAMDRGQMGERLYLSHTELVTNLRGLFHSHLL